MNINWKKKILLFLGGQSISLFGSSIVQFSIIWFVTRETASGTWVSALTICSFIPQMLISFISGVWADRYSKKAIIIAADAVIAAATLCLFFLIPYIRNDTIILYTLLIVSVIRSLGTGIQQPSVNAFIPEIVPQEQLMKINGINATLQSAVQFAAPAAAGAVLTFSSLRSSLAIDVATAAAAITLMFFIRTQKKQDTPKISSSAVHDLMSGVKYTFGDKFLGRLLISYGIFIFLCVPAGFLATLFVSRTYGNSYADMSITEIIGFIGMTAGGLIIGAWGGFKNRMTTLLTGLVAFGTLAVAMGAVKNFIFYLSLMFIYGIALTMIQTSVTTMIQENAGMDMQGRVFGFLGSLYSGCLPLGMIVFGPLSDVISLNLIMILSGILLLVMALVIKADKSFDSNNTTENKSA
ncbi:MAG: MFS transporter [Oscillospiraceae bacterium]|nr:MFS transporter [Oscillospiraceae bacterium]